MANFYEDIKRIMDEAFEDGTVDTIIKEKIRKGMENAIDSAFKWGELKDAIEKRVKNVLVPYIESYDMGDYITKLDTVLTDIVNQTALQDNAQILGNFKKLMIEPGVKSVTLKDILGQYKKYVADNMETSGRGIVYDGTPHYEPMGVTAEIVKEEDRPWGHFEYATLELAVEEEEQKDALNFSVQLSRWDSQYEEKGYAVRYDVAPSIHGLSRLSDFEIYILRLARAGVRVLDDIEYIDDEVVPTEEPEATYV